MCIKKKSTTLFIFVRAANSNSSSRAQPEHTTSPCRTLCHQSGAAQRWSSETSGRTNRKTSARADGLEPGGGNGVKMNDSDTSTWTKRKHVSKHWNIVIKISHWDTVDCNPRKHCEYSQRVSEVSPSFWTDPCPKKETILDLKKAKQKKQNKKLGSTRCSKVHTVTGSTLPLMVSWNS